MSIRERGLAILLAVSASAFFWAPPAVATLELDRQYALESIGFLRAHDNVDGLFAEYVAAAYKEYFARQSRFIPHDLGKADEILTRSKLPYSKVIQDKEILAQLTRATRTQVLLRTQIFKEGRQYRFTIEMLHAPRMDVIENETFILNDTSDTAETAKPEAMVFGPENLKAALQQALDRLIGKLPFVANITGRDSSSVTVNIGANARLKPGDTLVVATLDDVKKHPLLNRIVQWRLTPTGKVEITETDEAIAFGKVIEEEEDRHITRFQKVTRIIPRPQPEVSSSPAGEEQVSKMEEPPRIGWVAGSLPIGGLSRQYSSLVTSGTSSQLRDGGALLFGIKADSQIWLNEEFFADIALGYQFGSYSQDLVTTTTDSTTGETSTAIASSDSVSASVTTTKIALGYSYLISGEFFGPKGWLKVGYHGNSYSLPFSETEKTAPISFKSLFLGVGGELPLRDRYGAVLNLEFGLFPSANESGKLSGTVNSATDVAFFFGGYYRLNPRMTIRAGLDIMGHNAEFSSNTSLNQKVITFSPALLYYF